MRGDITLKLLESIKDFALDSVDLWGAFLTSGYGASLNKIEYNMMKKRFARGCAKSSESIPKEDFNKIRNRFYAMVSSLEKDGLVEISKEKGDSRFKITQKGKNKLYQLKERKAHELPIINYKANEGNNLVIVMFDIPENERKKRVWLRSALVCLGFKMVQKSVWMGKVKIPKDFLGDLAEIRIIKFVEIFEVGKTGSLKNLKELKNI